MKRLQTESRAFREVKSTTFDSKVDLATFFILEFCLHLNMLRVSTF